MLVQIITENGQKKIKPLTADAGAGNPVGSLISMYKKSSPSGYLYCDGSTFDATKYPLLYAYLGTNVLPDYREFALVGAEENTTDVYNASTNPNGTIHEHDVYTEGQAKDDQLQDHEHNVYVGNDTRLIRLPNSTASVSNGMRAFTNTGSGDEVHIKDVVNARYGTVTRGKRKAVYFYIKATSGLSENAQDNVINTLNEQRSYSTEEINTGKKWIDGKPIYRKVLNTTTSITYSENSWGGLQTEITDLNINKCIRATAISINGGNLPMQFVLSQGFKTYGSVSTGIGANIILEYTKTTD